MCALLTNDVVKGAKISGEHGGERGAAAIHLLQGKLCIEKGLFKKAFKGFLRACLTLFKRPVWALSLQGSLSFL